MPFAAIYTGLSVSPTLLVVFVPTKLPPVVFGKVSTCTDVLFVPTISV